MAFDWVQFLRSRGIAYSDDHPRISGSNIVTRCPYCGDAGVDPKHNMSISTVGAGWRCWRKPGQHKGINPTRLVQALLGCSWETARGITGSSIHVPKDLLSQVNDCLLPRLDAAKEPLTLPKEFFPLTRDMPARRPYHRYLLNRGFLQTEIGKLTTFYDMYYCTRGPYKYRIVFVVRDGDKIITWTGRSIARAEELRYKTLSPDPEKSEEEGFSPAIDPITDHLLWYDRIKASHADTFVLVEGPFDALKINILAAREGIVSTCFFTSQPNRKQIDLLHPIVGRFKRRIILLDAGTLPTSMWLEAQLRALDFETRQLPAALKDPGLIANFKQLSRILD